MTMKTDPACAQLLSLAVHEFRTPASVVSGYLRMLQRDTESPLGERHRRLVDEAEKSCARLVALVAELSEVSKLDAGLITMAAERLDVFALVQEVADSVHEAEDRGVRLSVSGSAAQAMVVGDAGRLRTALGAIFRAVLREQPGSGTVVVERRVERRDAANSAILVIAPHHGVASAYEAAPAVFDEKRGGLGLALPIARRILEVHGGRIWSPGESSERGAALISLPLSE
jgi:signal transduction histidine kinase